MLEFGIDELTLVLQVPQSQKAYIDPLDWSATAEGMISKFARKANLSTVFGAIRTELRPPSGYTIAYSFGEHNHYFAVAYHPCMPNMGVVVKFSALSLNYYLEASGLRVYEFLQQIQDNAYDMRLSRIDLVADFIDEGIDPTKIYQDLMSNKVAVFRERINKDTGEISLRRQDMKYQGFIKGEEIPTIYLGSAKSKAQLRIYDKRLEQIERNGSQLDKAIKCKDWTRFEGVFRSDFAHQITDELLRIRTDSEYVSLIASMIVQKFQLIYIDDGVIDVETEYTQLLIDAITNQTLILSSPSSRNHDLAKSLAYLLEGSGAITTLYKIKEIWGEDALYEALAVIASHTINDKPNNDCRYWLQKNSANYKKNYPDFDDFLKDSLSLLLP